MQEEYPQDFFVKIDNNEFLLGRLTLNKLGDKFAVDIDVVQKESKKIYRHVDIIYEQHNQNEALDNAVQKLSNYLRGMK